MRVAQVLRICFQAIANDQNRVIPAAAAQLYYTNKAISSQDLSFTLWEATIALQLVQFLAIFTVCAPNLKPFLDSLESGQIRVDDLRRQGKSGSNGYPTYQVGQSGQKPGQRSAHSSRPRGNSSNILQSATSHHSNVHEMVDLPGPKTQEIDQAQGGQKRSWDGQSNKSHSSQTILIRQTWQVDVQSVSGKAVD